MSQSQRSTGAGRSKQPYGKAYGGSAPENYERYFVPSIGGPLAGELVATAAIRQGERVLDVACGTGVVARLASGLVGQTGTVVGLDVNPGMLAVARTATPSGASIAWHEASAEAMPLQDGSFDVVTCQMGLQFMADRSAALREMRRVLAPGGRVILNVPGPTPRPFAVMADALANHINPEVAQFVHHVFSLHDRKELQTLAEDAGFEEVTVQSDVKTLRLSPPGEFLWQYVHSTPMAAAVSEADEPRRASLECDVVARWQPFVKDGALSLEVRISVVTARKR